MTPLRPSAPDGLPVVGHDGIVSAGPHADTHLRQAPEVVATVDYHGQIVVISVRGDLDLVTAPHLGRAAHAALATSPRGVVIDLTAVTLLASMGIAAVIDAYRSAGPELPCAVIARGAVTARRLEVLGLIDFLHVQPDLKTALRSVTTGSHLSEPPAPLHDPEDMPNSARCLLRALPRCP